MQDLKGEVLNVNAVPIPGAVCTLRGYGLPSAGI
jgi:hypothetical protein